MNIDNLTEEFLRVFGVPNLVNKYKRVILIFESPTEKDVEMKLPLTDTFGKYIYSNIFKEEIPSNFNNLGELLKYRPENEIGIMNLFRLPILKDSTSYKTNQLFMEDVIGFFEKLGPKKEIDEIGKVILSDFELQLTKLNREKVVLIPIGKNVKTIFKMLNLEEKGWECYSGIPHPKSNSWSQKRNADKIEKITKKIFSI